MSDDRHSSPLLEMKETGVTNGETNGATKLPNGNTEEGDGVLGDGTPGVTLKRQVGIVGSFAMLVGTIIGSGIFSSPSSVSFF